jgi:hypothetical protein
MAGAGDCSGVGKFGGMFVAGPVGGGTNTAFWQYGQAT